MRKNSFFVTTALSLCLIGATAFAQTNPFGSSVSLKGDPSRTDNITADGSVTFANGTFTLNGNGDDVWGNWDECFYTYTELSGSKTVSAQVIWDEPGTDPWSKVGVMIREKPTNAQSKHFSSIVRGSLFGDQVEAQHRLSEGGSSTGRTFQEFGINVAADPVDGLYLRVSRVVRAGNDLFVSEWSRDGSTWVVGDYREMDMQDTVGFGLYITSHLNDAALVTATAKNIKLQDPNFVFVTRSFNQPTIEPNQTATVTLTVMNGGTAAQTVAIEDIVPDGWTASALSNGGTNTNNVLRWNYNAPVGESKITYQAKAPAVIESAAFEGTVGESGPMFGAASMFYLFPLAKDNKVDAPALSNTVTLDGKMSPGEWTGAATFTFDAEDQVPPGVFITKTIPKDLQNVTGHAFHNANNIYVALDVVDNILDFDVDNDGDEGNTDTWRHDSTEIYFDGDLSRTIDCPQDITGFQGTVMGNGTRNGGYGGGTMTPLAGGGGASSDGAWWNAGASAKADGSGYIVEYQIMKSILSPSDRKLIGFDVLMNGSDEPGNIDREDKWGWFQYQPDGTLGEYWDNENGWGVMELTGQVSGIFDWSSF